MSLALCMLSVLPMAAGAGEVNGNEREKLQGTIAATVDYAIGLLEKKEYRKLIETLVHPADLKSITETKSLDEVAAAFGEGKAAEVLDALKAIKGKEPTYTDNKTRAVFSKENHPALKRDLRFEKSDKLWYIRN